MNDIGVLHQLPCQVLITDMTGGILAINQTLLQLVGGTEQFWLQSNFEKMLPAAGRIFLQTHIWPTLLREGRMHEIYLNLLNADQQRVPSLLNCHRGDFSGGNAYFWIFVTVESRHQFETALLQARSHAETTAMALTKKERFIKLITDAVPSMIAYWDKQLHCQFSNHAYWYWFKKSSEEMRGIHLSTLLGEQIFSLNQPFIDQALEGKTQQFERKLIASDGSTRDVLVNYLPDISSNGEIVGFIALTTDVTALKETEAALSLAASVFDSTAEGIVVADADNNILSVNPAFSNITGYSAQETLGRNPHFLMSNHQDATFFSNMWHMLDTAEHWQGEVWLCRKDGQAFPCWQTISKICKQSGAVERYVTVFHDMSEIWHKNEQIKHLAYHDALTALPNRTTLLKRLAQQIQTNEHTQRQLALLFLDLDGFKLVNDQFGHAIGDELLKTVARRLEGLIRASDTVARFGGDEFVIMLDNPTNHEEVARIATRIIHSIGQTMVLQGQAVQVGVSIGIALYGSDAHSMDELMKCADTAMYAAKLAGKNTFQFFSAIGSTVKER